MKTSNKTLLKAVFDIAMKIHVDEHTLQSYQIDVLWSH